MRDSSEYDCARCGIRVVWVTPPPPESLYCLQCRIIVGIEDPQVRQEIARVLQPDREEESAPPDARGAQAPADLHSDPAWQVEQTVDDPPPAARDGDNELGERASQ